MRGLLDSARRAPARRRERMELVDARVERTDGLPIDPETERALLANVRDLDARAALDDAARAKRQLDAEPPTALCFRGLDLERPQDVAEAWHRLGWDPDGDPFIRQLADAGVAPIAGGSPVGVSGMGFQHNLPEPGSFVEDSAAFFANTERNDIPGPAQAYPGLGGGGVDVRIPQVGVLAEIEIVGNFTLTVSGTGTVTATYQWPHNVIKRGALNVNGQTGIISCEGQDLRARNMRVYHNPRDEITSGPATDMAAAPGANYVPAVGNPQPGVIANGTYSVQLTWRLPITHDDYNLIGALYAQSDSNAFNWRFEAAAAADLFTIAAGGAATLTGTLNWTYTVYDIPEGDTQQGRVVLLPNMAWLHGMLAFNQTIVSTGETAIVLIRTAGQLLCTYVYIDSGGNAILDPASLVELRQQYGGNRRSRVFNPPIILLIKNARDYSGRILGKTGGYVLFDNEIDNPVRDLIYPKGVTELQIVANIPASVVLGTNPRAHAVEESMFPGR